MNRRITVAILAACMLPVVQINAQTTTKSNGSNVIYTGELGKQVNGFKGNTPVNITIKDGKIEKIEALDNEESEYQFNNAKQKVFSQYVGKTVAEAKNVKADVATGATYSSNALIKNIQLGLNSYKTNTTSTSTSKKKTTTKKKSTSTKKKSTKKKSTTTSKKSSTTAKNTKTVANKKTVEKK